MHHLLTSVKSEKIALYGQQWVGLKWNVQWDDGQQWVGLNLSIQWNDGRSVGLLSLGVILQTISGEVAHS
jgi:hypothetical protein